MWISVPASRIYYLVLAGENGGPCASIVALVGSSHFFNLLLPLRIYSPSCNVMMSSLAVRCGDTGVGVVVLDTCVPTPHGENTINTLPVLLDFMTIVKREGERLLIPLI